MDAFEITICMLGWMPMTLICVLAWMSYEDWKRTKKEENLTATAESFALWAMLTTDTPLRSLEKDRKIQHICDKMCAALTPEEIEIILALKEETSKEARNFFEVLGKEDTPKKGK